ncbi:hypothetical protein ON010_g7105 [Phytophthora cinnamomi]|nr:hypothetical protein ON010_g7105 [Phytophthora cinnamomi]
MAADVAEFVNGCLRCMTTAGGRIPLQFEETLTATRPNELLHFDYLSMVEGVGGVKYILALKDGAHFRNEVVECLQRALGAHHHFATANTPWANDCVSKTGLPSCLSALNAMPADRLGGATPLTVFTALPGNTQLSILHPRDPAGNATVTWVADEIAAHLTAVRVALDGIHVEMVDASEKHRRAARERHARRQCVRLQKFNEGNFVPAATATGRSGNKLALVWRGPKKIVRALNQYAFKVQAIVEPFEVSIRHASRLQLYRDASRGQGEELREQSIYGEGSHLVEALRDCRVSPDTHQWEILIKWFGLNDIEASWELAEVIETDVSVLFNAFVAAGDAGSSIARMLVDLHRRALGPASLWYAEYLGAGRAVHAQHHWPPTEGGSDLLGFYQASSCDLISRGQRGGQREGRHHEITTACRRRRRSPRCQQVV